MSNYTILHLHTMLSNAVTNIDSVDTYKNFINKASECGMKALAFSEHGNVLGWTSKKKEIEAHGMKYIHAEEFYVTENLNDKIRDNYHCLLIAKNYDGVLELNKLSTISFNRNDNHFYYQPRISYDELINTSDNIIICTACLGGILSKGHKDLKNKFFNFIRRHKDRCFFEIQHHQSADQKKYNKILYDIATKYGIRLVMTTDTHALNEQSLKARAIMQKAKNVHFDEEDEFDIVFKTYDELVEACKKQNAIPMSAYLEAIENTNVIADIVEEFTLDTEYKYPHLWGNNSERVLRDKINKGIIERGVDKYPNYEEYLDRIEYEMQAYEHNQAIDFMLLMTDILDWCREQGIEVGYGRGSVNGSVIAWLLHITEMDSIKHKLNFDRFMNTSRVSLSDIDTDFPPSRIEEVKQYIYHKHGLYCSDIVTFNTIALKGAIRDVGRALEIPLDEVDEICKNIEQSEETYRKQYTELFKYVDMVQGTIVSVGSHPCGCVVSPFSVDDRMGLFTTATSNYPISQINMKEIDALNYVKLDLLRLDTIEIINNTCAMANIERVTPDNLDITDVKVWNSMRDDTTQIFQWEGSTGNDYIKKLLSDENIKKFQEIDENVDRMTLLSIGNSAIRPAGASYRDDLANGVVRKSGSQAIDDFLKPTFGYLVFQCQIIEFLHSYCGFTMGEADVVRRHFAKKYGTDKDIPIIENGGYINDNKDHYIKGFIATMKEQYNMSKEEAKETIKNFLQVIEDASNYLFSLNHSQPYSFEGYACGWLRYYYPLEFITASLNINIDKEEKTKDLIAYAKKRGIKIQNPKFRKSKDEYFFSKEDNCIYKGISSLKNVGKIGNDLYALKDTHFNSFIDVLSTIDNHKICNSRELEILISIGFFDEFGNPNQLLKIVELYNKFATAKVLSKDKLTQEEKQIIHKYAQKETPKQFRDIDNIGLLWELCNQLNIITSDIDKVSYELKYLGYSNIIADTPYFGVESIETNQYGTTYIKLYHISVGDSLTFKVDRKWMNQFTQEYGGKLEQGDILDVTIEEKPKRKKVEGEWVEVGTELVLTAFCRK